MKVAWSAKVSRQFVYKILRICYQIRILPDNLMSCIAFETGETFSPSIVNKYSGATGLIQFMPQTAGALGTTTEELASMSAVHQLDYVRKYFSPYKNKLKTLEDTYMAILWPRGIGKPVDYVIFDKSNTNNPKLYIQNKGLDYNKNGLITVGEAAQKVREKLDKGLELSNFSLTDYFSDVEIRDLLQINKKEK